MTGAIWLSLQVSLLSTLLVVVAGTATGRFLARTRTRWAGPLELLVALPVVFPPTLTGYYLILLFGRNGWIGGPLHAITGFQFTFHLAGAVLASAVVSFPLMALSARAALAGVDPDLERAGATLGRSGGFVFLRVTLPLAFPGLAAGAMLSFARALGEFGATLMVAGNVQTLPLAVYRQWMSGGMAAAAPFVAVHTLFAIAVLAAALLLRRRHGGALV